jgi:hypothetical protein
LQETALAPTDLTTLASLITDAKHPKGHVIMQQGHLTNASLYMVREGKVQLKSKTIDKVVEKGGYFGEEMLTFDTSLKRGDEYQAPSVPAPYTVTVLSDDVTVGVLTLEECRTVLDTSTIGKGRMAAKKDERPEASVLAEKNLKLEDLEKHTILGAGTFGQVWLVSRSGSDGSKRPYALKIQSKYELIQNSQAQGVIQEKKIMAQLHHPLIIQLVNTYQDPDLVYMLLRLYQGGELFSVLHQENRDGVPEQEAKFYAAGVLEGLSYMHRRHIIYRDLKPENVLIDEDGYPIIVDLGFGELFGSARSVSKNHTLFTHCSRFLFPSILFCSQVCS